MKKRIISAVVVLVISLGLCGFVWADSNRFEPLQQKVTVEYGSKLSQDPAEYIAAVPEVLAKTKLDLSQVDVEQVGEYEATAICGEKKAAFQVVVEDTIPPEIKLKAAEVNGVRGKAIPSTTIIEAVTDKAGIDSIAFDQGQVDLEGEELLTSTGLQFDKVGEYEVKLTATDKNGLSSEETVSVKIVEDYLAHVSGIKDITIEKGSKIDWMKDVKGDDRILEVTADASKVETGKEGSYELTYVIKGDDKETVVKKTVTVTVVSAAKAQKLADQGEVVRTTNGTKQKTPVYTPSKRSGSGSGSSRYSGGGSSGGGSSSSRGSGSSNSGKKGSGGNKNSWTSDSDSGGYIGGGSKDSGGNTWESGSFTW